MRRGCKVEVELHRNGLNFKLWENSGEGWANFARRWQQCPRLAVGSKSVSLEWL